MASACSSTLLSVSAPRHRVEDEGQPRGLGGPLHRGGLQPGGFSASGRLQITVVTPSFGQRRHVGGVELRGDGIPVDDLL
jgi:hypothetical protein